MSREIDLCQYLPEVIKNVREYQVLCSTESPQVNAMWKALEVVFDNGFLESLTEYGCSRWETILGLTADKNDSLAVRRKNIWIRLNENLPYTWRRLVLLMNEICGENGYHMELKHNDYFLDISIQLTEENLESHIVKQVIFAGYLDSKIDGGEDVLSLGHTEFIAPMIKAIQQQQMIEQLQKEIELLKG